MLEYMKKLLIMSSLFLYAFLGCKEEVDDRPNIIFILGDDISQEDIACYGNTHIRTPHIDALAKDGLRFTNMFVTSSSCSPSRTSILTGRYPHNTGAAELHSELPAGLTYFPELLKMSGYYTALAGKWHEGSETKRAYDTLLVDKQQNGEGGEEQWIKLLQQRPKNKPFMFWLATYDAHREWSANTAFAKPYRPEEVQVPATLLDDAATRKDLASYYNEISRIDDYIGKLREELAKQGIAENTIILFTADNARPFSGSKTRLLDRGIKEPFVVSWPKGIKSKGRDVAALVSSIDVAPTLLHLAGVEIGERFQGKSFHTLLQKPDADFRTYIFAEHNWHDYEAYERAVRTKDFLYILNERPQYDNGGPIDANQSPSAKALKDNGDVLTAYQAEALRKPTPREEFFDHTKDPLQERNLFGEKAYAKDIDRLKQVLKQWQEETGDNVPAALTPDWYDRFTGAALPAKGSRGEMPGSARNAVEINAKGPF